ncbi:predicted protein [Chaetomium globosum CBS 148.51]|uniref:Uncharacterized protein n=1 Tax=Chaetomium globosum (strain ATCC 6205 / CBS 148.51 / DSM 1962 / NBRC 6347 / NRRL 1970) TaxID=306901 RepID=Q2GRA2_CHAGB|nr:uncharacterized protein CHGG_09502 [Chaetomium globosum CBS 148.51]EAQ85488.1 predicted protein [Chaetomium globosum CBS 148.51]
MSGIEVIGVILSVIPVVTRLVKHFGTERNAPRQVERLSRMLEELQDERLWQSAMPTEQKHMQRMLDRCTKLMDKEMAAGQRSRAWKFFWSAEAESRLKEHNDELDRELDRLQRRVEIFLRTQASLLGGLLSKNLIFQQHFPRGNIWFEDEDLEDLSVSFLEAHDITIQDAEGYKVYRSYSIYQFGTVAHREEFLVHVRERQLLGRYFAEKIWERGELIAQQKVVRLWRKTTSRESQKTTLSFIGRDERPYERPLVDFRRSPTLRENRVDLVDVVGGGKTTVEFRRPPKPPKTKSKLFGSRSKSTTSLTSEGGTNYDLDAARFKEAFEANHPATFTFSPLTLRPTGGEASLHDIPGLSPSLPALSPTSSSAPTLYTISLPPASIASLSDDLPVSPRTSIMPVWAAAGSKMDSLSAEDTQPSHEQTRLCLIHTGINGNFKIPRFILADDKSSHIGY